MDVGCGTGILSIFCAQAGARRVSYPMSKCVFFLKKIYWKNAGIYFKIVLGLLGFVMVRYFHV